MRTFERDHRSNEGLHKLYVSYALETLEALEEALETLEGASRFEDSMFASSIRERIALNVANDAAWFEAAAIRYCKGFIKEPVIEEQPLEH